MELICMKRKRINAFLTAILLMTAVFLVSGCRFSAAEYTIRVEGRVSEPGVIEFAGIEMNVYQDQASNPCGDCPDQPVSIYVGSDAETTVKAMSEAIRRTDDVWEVVSGDGGVLKLREKQSEAGSVEEEPALSAPKGLKMTGEFQS